jgi:hypothetical protein
MYQLQFFAAEEHRQLCADGGSKWRWHNQRNARFHVLGIGVPGNKIDLYDTAK